MFAATQSHPPALRFAAFFIALIAALAVAPASAQTGDTAADGPDSIVATVGGEAITEADLAFAAEDLGQDLANIPQAERRAFLLTVLIDMKVMANAARKAKLDETDLFKRRLAYLEERALRRAFFADQVSGAVTPEAMQTAYESFIEGFPIEEEIRARHILVATEADAQAVLAELEAGAAFEQLASEKSMDPGGSQNGGDLGFFTRGMMVPSFEEAAFALEPGQLSVPVESQFGWHVIRLEERRQSQPPTLEEVAPQVQQQLLFDAFDEVVGALKRDVAIDISDPTLAAQVAAQDEDGAEPPAQ